VHELESIKEQITKFYQGILEDLAQACGGDYGQLIRQWQEIHGHYLALVNGYLEKWARDHTPAAGEGIYAREVVVEVAEAGTGRVLRRLLPMEYWETENGIRLIGETVDGVATHLAFLSETGALRMKDILGQGRDTPRCQ